MRPSRPRKHTISREASCSGLPIIRNQKGSEWSGIAKAADTVTRFKAASGGPPGASPLNGASIINVESTGAHYFKGKASRYFEEAPEHYNVQLLWTGNRPVDNAVDDSPQ